MTILKNVSGPTLPWASIRSRPPGPPAVPGVLNFKKVVEGFFNYSYFQMTKFRGARDSSWTQVSDNHLGFYWNHFRYMVILVKRGEIFLNSQSLCQHSWQITSSHNYFTIFLELAVILFSETIGTQIGQKYANWKQKSYILQLKFCLVLKYAI